LALWTPLWGLSPSNDKVSTKAGQVQFTDGVTEARSADGEEFGEQRLADLLVAHRTAEPEDIADRMMDTVARWNTGGPRDDQALVVARVLPWGTNVSSPSRPGEPTVPILPATAR